MCAQSESEAQLIVGDIIAGLKHHSIHCVSVTESFKSIINLSIEQLWKLMVLIRTDNYYLCCVLLHEILQPNAEILII